MYVISGWTKGRKVNGRLSGNKLTVARISLKYLIASSDELAS